MKGVSKRLVAALVLAVALCVLLLAACAKDEAQKGESDKTDATTAVTTTQKTTGTTQKGFIGDGANVRNEPNMNGESTQIYDKQEVTIIDKEGDWYEIEYKDPQTGEDKKGYVSGQVIEIVGNPNASQMQEERPTTATAVTTESETVQTDENGDPVPTTTTNTDGRVEGIPITGIEDDPNF